MTRKLSSTRSPPPPVDIASWLDCKNHSGRDLASSRLMRVGRLVRARTDAVADRVRRLAREAHRVDPGADPAIELSEARARAREVDRVVVDRDEPGFELAVLRRQLTDDEVLRVIAPVAVDADPDLEERRLAFDDGPCGRRREGLDPRARPDEREAERELDLPSAQPVPSPWTNPSHSAAICASLMPGSMIRRQCSIAAAAMSFARRMRSISCAVLSARAATRAVASHRRRRRTR